MQTSDFAAKVFNQNLFTPLTLPSFPTFGPMVDNFPDLFSDLKLAALVSQALPGLGDNISTVGEQLSRYVLYMQAVLWMFVMLFLLYTMLDGTRLGGYYVLSRCSASLGSLQKYRLPRVRHTAIMADLPIV